MVVFSEFIPLLTGVLWLWLASRSGLPAVLLGAVPGTLQRVEKVGFELIATTNRAQNALKRAFSYPICGESEHQGSFQHAGPFCEVR